MSAAGCGFRARGFGLGRYASADALEVEQRREHQLSVGISAVESITASGICAYCCIRAATGAGARGRARPRIR